MPVYLLDESLTFPPAGEAEPSGLLAVGGDLKPERLLRAYGEGIFPWYSADEPILWFSPDPRAVIEPARLRVGRGTRRTLAAAAGLTLSADRAFAEVIRGCARMVRPGQSGTWITSEMMAAYIRLHRLGYAHSVEAWRGGELVGGIYGVSIGRYFAAESMFRTVTGGSLKPLVALVRQLAAWDFEIFDCQMHTPHVGRLGAELWPRKRFLARLGRALEAETRRGPWSLEPDLPL